MNFALGKRKKAQVTTPKRKASGVKEELRSPGAPAEEFVDNFQGFVSEGKFLTMAHHVRYWVTEFEERLRSLWKGATDLKDRCFIPRKSPMFFQWHPNTSWNPREWIHKRMALREQTHFWDDEELMKRVHEFAQPHIDARRRDTVSAKHLQTAISGLFETKNVKDAHIFAWMVAFHMHGDLEDAGEWSLILSIQIESWRQSSISSFTCQTT